VAIDGFGGIGRAVLRSAIERDGSYGRGTPAATLLAHVAHGAIVGGFIFNRQWVLMSASLGAIVVVGRWRTGSAADGANPASPELLCARGADVEPEPIRETERRAASAYAQLLTLDRFRATTLPNDDGPCPSSKEPKLRSAEETPHDA
jgi:hypothetical protein